MPNSIILFVIPDAQTFGTGILVLFLPIFLIYAFLFISRRIHRENTKFKPLLLAVVLINILIIVLITIFKFLHLPGAGIMFFSSAIFILALICIGIIYIIQNRKALNVHFTLEFILIFLPTFIFFLHYFPFNTSITQQEYSSFISSATSTIDKINHKIADTSCYHHDIEKIKQLKKDIILSSGGLHENGSLENFFVKSQILKDNINYLESLETSTKIKAELKNVKYAGESVLILTQIENELVLQNCLK